MAYILIYDHVMCRITLVKCKHCRHRSDIIYGGRKTTNKRDVSTGVLKAKTTNMSKADIVTDQLASYSLLFQYYSWNGEKAVNMKPLFCFMSSDSFTILGLWVLGLATSNINESPLQTNESKHYF